MAQTERKPSRTLAIVKLGLPILIGQLGMIIVGFADTKMVGLYSTEALASASFVNNLFNVCIFACVGFTYGLTPLIGALFSQKRLDAIGNTLRNGVVINILFAMLLTAIMTAVYINLHNLGQPEELLPLIRPYFLIYLAGLIPVALFNVFAQWAYAINRTKMPMWIILAANGINIFGNWLLIYGNWGCPELGLNGAGISTLVARVLCPLAIIGVMILRREYREYRTGFAAARINRRTLGLIGRTSVPVALQMTFESGSFTAAAVMAGWLGAIPLAAFQVIIITGTLGFCVYYSVAAAEAVLVSNAAGLGDRAEMRRLAFAGYRILLTLAATASCIFIFLGPQIIHQFTHDPEVISLALSMIVPLVIYQFGDATQINFANALRGTSNVMPMLWIAFISYVIIGLPATWLLGFPCGLGTYGIILSFSISLFIAAALFFYYFMRTTRKPR
ncbi:MAG: MATE family efflux transporter [Paramuribaculum sp.]|nr:MATE family efflux transporter [Paramuribaculum sp.]MDE7452152.1 MATE family efflux transporter [Paramuribaculum sp.]